MPRVVVLGLGYVGLPLATAMAKSAETWGFDIDPNRITELRSGYDRTGELEGAALKESKLRLTHDIAECPAAEFYIITVPTPVDANNIPDLSMLKAAARLVGAALDPDLKPVVIFESTVYPGATEEICGPELSSASGLVAGKDFFLGYSPERINPGDREHTVDRIVKVVSGDSEKTLDKVAALYGSITSAGVFRAKSIKAAEAAKVIENAQRDLNVAFMNEISRIFAKMDLSIWDVLAAARTKWNFLPFEPGLVGGHCIGVDPYYLAFRAKELGTDAEVILAGRDVNDGMAGWVAGQIHARRNARPGTVLMLGLAFKPDVPDLRNSKAADLAQALERLGHDVTVYDPLVDADAARHEYDIALDPAALERRYDLLVLAVPHQVFIDDIKRITSLVGPGGLIADLKNAIPDDCRSAVAANLWTL